MRFLLPYWSPRVIVCKDFDVIVTGSSMQKRTTFFEASRIEKAPEISGVSGRILSKNVLPYQSFLIIGGALLVFVFVAGEIMGWH